MVVFSDAHLGFQDGQLEVNDKFISRLDETGDRAVFTLAKGFIFNQKHTHLTMGNNWYVSKKGYRPETLNWIIHEEKDGEVWIYKPCRLGQHEYSLGDKAYNITGWSDMRILSDIGKDKTINGTDYKKESNHYIEKEPLKQVVWSKEMDGKSILVLLAAYPKMSYAEILNVILNEGGNVDESGIIHK